MKKAYRTYLIGYSAMSDCWWVEKDGTCIAYADDEKRAKKIIDNLVEGAKVPTDYRTYSSAR